METLFNNPFIFIILIAVLSSLFKKKKGNAESQKRAKGPMENRRTGSNSPFKDVKDIFKEVTRSLQDETNAPDRNMSKPYREDRKEVTQQAVELYQQKAAIDQETEQVLTEKQRSLPKSLEKQIEVNETKLVDAVIWAEILGPPRAKRPYGKTRR